MGLGGPQASLLPPHPLSGLPGFQVRAARAFFHCILRCSNRHSWSADGSWNVQMPGPAFTWSPTGAEAFSGICKVARLATSEGGTQPQSCGMCPSLRSWWLLPTQARFCSRFQGRALVYNICLMGLPWWSSGWESACECRGHGFNPWSGKIPRVAEPWSPPMCHNCWSPLAPEPVLCNKRKHREKKPTRHS